MRVAKQVQTGEITQTRRKYGLCVVCGDRVFGRHDYITAREGYCHRSCLM